MPLYEYQCTECEATLEAIQSFAAPPLEDCPECGRSSLKKLLSAPAIQFKGSGWYVNDYARKGNGNGDSSKSNGDAGNGKAAASESPSDKGKKSSDSTSSTSETKTETKSAAATP